jgi:pilus assembly protein CpaF
MQEIFKIKLMGVEDDGRVRRTLLPTGIRPRFCEKLEQMGIELRGALFDPEAYLDRERKAR